MNKQQFRLGMALAFAIIALCRPASFAQPGTSRDTLPKYVSATFVVSLNSGGGSSRDTTYMVTMSAPSSDVSGKDYALQMHHKAAPKLSFYRVSCKTCTLLRWEYTAGKIGLNQQQEVTDPELRARLRRVALRQLALFNKLILEGPKD